ncbi:hypothetical protein OIN59_20925 [Acidovorax sp. D2M1]|uniref:HotDog ACOT-type domain-containing protein n=1 Tax=Acidovorax benzenivorans TaxID=2987520 RepID=A0ABT5S1T1_9BURK|nr:hypothetical protein [Acidovorax benzenivorans]MDD2179911.1 hypothetical protein [Acidovorax benzenivorans]
MSAHHAAAVQTLLKTITMPADIDASGQVPTGWLLAKMDQAGAVLPGQHFRAPVELVGLADVTLLARPRLGQCVTFTGHLLSSSARDACVAIEAWCEERGQTSGTPLMRAQLRYAPATIEVPGNLFPGTFQVDS